jgi:hypothetical protein
MLFGWKKEIMPATGADEIVYALVWGGSSQRKTKPAARISTIQG